MNLKKNAQMTDSVMMTLYVPELLPKSGFSVLIAQFRTFFRKIKDYEGKIDIPNVHIGVGRGLFKCSERKEDQDRVRNGYRKRRAVAA